MPRERGAGARAAGGTWSVKVAMRDRDRLEIAEALRPLRGVIRTGAMRGFGEALGVAQAPAAAHAVRQRGPQTGARRAGGSTRQGH